MVGRTIRPFLLIIAKAFSVKDYFLRLVPCTLDCDYWIAHLSCLYYDSVVVDGVAYLMAQHANNASICDPSWRPGVNGTR